MGENATLNIGGKSYDVPVIKGSTTSGPVEPLMTGTS